MPMKVVQIRRWEILLAFCLLFVSYVVMGVYLKHDIDNNSRNKANLTRVEKGGCKIRTFLISSAQVRERLAQHDPPHSEQRRKDLKAAKVSFRLANSFSSEFCPAGKKGANTSSG